MKDQTSGSTYDKLYWYGAGAEVLVESDLAGTVLDEYVFFNGKRVARRRESDSAVFYFFSDHLGSSRVVTDSAGTIVEESDFYPFGGERVIVDSLDNNYKFTGHERDGESGLDYMKARHFASSLARFPQPDSFAFSSLTNPQSLNLYAYVLNNPLRFIDPTGQYPTWGPLPSPLPAFQWLPGRNDWGIFGSAAAWDGIYSWQADAFSAVNGETHPQALNGYVTHYTYDGSGNLVGVMLVPDQGPVVSVSGAEWNKPGVQDFWHAAITTGFHEHMDFSRPMIWNEKKRNYRFYVTDAAKAIEFLKGNKLFIEGRLGQLHAGVGKDWRDFRSRTSGDFKRSLQITLSPSRGLAEGDTDRFNPYQNPPWGLLAHFFVDVLGGVFR